MSKPSRNAARKGTGSKTVQTTVEAPALTPHSTADFIFAMATKLRNQPRTAVLLSGRELSLLVEALFYLTLQEEHHHSIEAELLADMLDRAEIDLLKAQDTEVTNAS